MRTLTSIIIEPYFPAIHLRNASKMRTLSV